MNIKFPFLIALFMLMANTVFSQTKQDSLEIRQIAFHYNESQRKTDPVRMEQAMHP